MQTSIFIGLINNVALLLALALLFDIISFKSRKESLRVQIIVGLGISLIGIAVMFGHWELRPGVIFDTRSILLSITGVYFGLIPTAIAAVVTTLLRIAQGGGGVYMGVGVIISSAAMGLLLRYAHRGKVENIQWHEILLLGIAVHVVMLSLTIILPAHLRLITFKNIALPVIILYPLGTVLLGKLLHLSLKRNRIETQLRASEQQLQESQRVAGLGSYVLDICSGKWVSSEILDSIFGIDADYPKTVAGWEALIYPEDKAMMMHHLQQEVVGQRGRFDKEYRIVKHSTGQMRWVHGLGVLELDEVGEPLKMKGTIQDITARKEIELALQQSEEKFREIFSNANDAIFIHTILPDGRAGKYIEVNEVACRRLGYSRDELLQLGPADIRAPEFAAITDDLLQEMIQKERYSTELVHQTKTGETFPVEVNTHVFDLAGEKVVLAVARDISRRRQMEEEFRQAQKMESIGRLAGGIAHDFNNLLTVINGYTSILSEELSDVTSAKTMLENVLKAGERAARLTNQLLAFSRKQILNPEVLNLNTLVEETRNMLQRIISESIILKTRLDSDLSTINADRGQIEQVIINLVVNAGDAMPNGGTLTLETRNVTLGEDYRESHPEVIPGNYVLFALTDTGVGMSPETQEHIFEPFYTTKEKGKGTGLGLATVHGIIRQSGGFIWVYSELGKGSIFKIYLPVADAEARIRDSSPTPQRSLSGSETVLVAEDEIFVRHLARDVLMNHGYSVLEASNGESAVALYREQGDSINLILTDVVMPHMSGKQLVDNIRKMGHKTPVIYMSGYTENAIVHHGVLEENVDFIQKPFGPNQLLEMVRRVLDRR
ncbi:MAG: PAS domain S-box protein [Lentisphaeria bacterium]|nr:PAS domain S-box protein [Candidatus Neomarinimicrobiota bacterium]MCF7843021.1 PAS domain S-box protein [Lentisphaeria bacterium]